jgi:hypothetical protein
VVSGAAPVPGNAGFGRSVSPCPPSWRGSSAGPSTATIAAPASDILRCNIVGTTAVDESAPRTLSADIGVSAVGGEFPSVSQSLAFRHGL